MSIHNAARTFMSAAAPAASAAAIANPITAAVATGMLVSLAAWKYGECAADTYRSGAPMMRNVGQALRRGVHRWTSPQAAPRRPHIVTGQ